MLLRIEPLTLAGRTTLCAAFILISAGVSQAQVTGKIWENDPSTSADVVPSGTPNMTFTSSQILWESGSAYTISEFMNFSPTTTTFGNIQSGSSPSDSLGAGTGSTFFQLTGTIHLASGTNNFQVGHDDGLNISVAGIGTVLDQPGSTAFVLTPFTITAPSAGNYTFTVDYIECCSPPADLEWAYPNGTVVTGAPDGGMTVGLLGAGLAALGVFARRIRK